MIIYLVIIFIFTFIYGIIYSRETYINYRKCKKNMNMSIVKKIKLILGDNFRYNYFDWNLFIPCGYTNVESELNSLSIKNLNQKIFGISGCDLFANKLYLFQIMYKRYNKNYSEYMPRSYENSYDGLNRLLNETKSSDKFIVKKNIQAQKGLYIVHDISQIYNIFNDNSYVIIQELLKNPFLIDGRKINIRIYLLIKCHNGLVNGYIYNDGFIYYTPKEYDYHSLDNDSHITTGYISREVYKHNPLTLQDLYVYLDKKNNNNSVKLKNNIIKLFENFMSAFYENICNSKNLANNMSFQVFGADIAPDNRLSVKLIEVNKGPDMDSKDERDNKLKIDLLKNGLHVTDISNTQSDNFIEVW